MSSGTFNQDDFKVDLTRADPVRTHNSSYNEYNQEEPATVLPGRGGVTPAAPENRTFPVVSSG